MSMLNKYALEEIRDKDLMLALLDNLDRIKEDPPRMNEPTKDYGIRPESDAEYKLRCIERRNHIEHFIGAILGRMRERGMRLDKHTYDQVVRLFYART